MTDIFLDASAWLGRMFKDNAARPVTYSRGELSVQIIASKGRTVYVIEDGVTVQEIVMEDFIFDAVDLVLNGRVVLPVAGDRIDRIVGDSVVTYEVTEQSGKQAYSFINEASRERIRAHTVIVAES